MLIGLTLRVVWGRQDLRDTVILLICLCPQKVYKRNFSKHKNHHFKRQIPGSHPQTSDSVRSWWDQPSPTSAPDDLRRVSEAQSSTSFIAKQTLAHGRTSHYRAYEDSQQQRAGGTPRCSVSLIGHWFILSTI